MVTSQLPLPTQTREIALVLVDELQIDALDISDTGLMALKAMLLQAAQKISARWRGVDDYDGYAAAFDEVQRQFERLIARAQVAAEYQTITEDILQKAREWLCPFFCLCD